MQVELNQEALVTAIARQLAHMLIQDAGFVQRLAASAVSGLLSYPQLKAVYDAEVAKAMAKKTTEIEQMLLSISNQTSLRTLVDRVERDAERKAREAAQSMIEGMKIRVQRTLRQAVAELIKDRVDALVNKLMTNQA